MKCHYCLLICTVYILCVIRLSSTEKPCPPSILGACSENETCSQKSKSESICICRIGYQRNSQSGTCLLIQPTNTSESPSDQPATAELPQSSVSASTIEAGILIPMLIIFVIGLVLAGRRYQWLQRVRHLRVRRYDEVRIGQDDDDDDPPLA